MTDKYHSITVILEKDILLTDAEVLINMIKEAKGVRSVHPNASGSITCTFDPTDTKH